MRQSRRLAARADEMRGFPRTGRSPPARQLVGAEPAATSPAIRSARDAQLASLAEPAGAYSPFGTLRTMVIRLVANIQNRLFWDGPSLQRTCRLARLRLGRRAALPVR